MSKNEPRDRENKRGQGIEGGKVSEGNYNQRGIEVFVNNFKAMDYCLCRNDK